MEEYLILLEGRIDNARDRYPDIPDDIFQQLVDMDPSGNQKYLDWLAGQMNRYIDFNKDNPMAIDRFIRVIGEALSVFHKDGKPYRQD